jgi:hypothetical protein
MTVKLTKTIITGFDIDGIDYIGLNPNVRLTMGYSDNNINIKVDKVVRPDLTRDEQVEVSYETILEKSLSSSEFAMDTDNKSWYIEYDVINNEISILDVLKFGSSNKHKMQNYHSNQLHRDIKIRYNQNYLPLVYIKTFDKSANGFDNSLLNFYIQDNPGEVSDTIITNSDVDLMTTQERHRWIANNLVSYITFIIKNEDGSEVITNEQTRLNQLDVNGQDSKSNQYRVTLPAAKYTIQVNVDKTLYPDLENTYNITVLNGYINKTRVSTGAGSFTVKLDLSELESSDYSKLKLDLGQFLSYAELWVDIE